MTASSHKLTCRNGHTFPLPPELAHQEVVPCPACTVNVVVPRSEKTAAHPQPGKPEPAENSAPRARGLWQVMQGHHSETATDAEAARLVAERSSVATESKQNEPRGEELSAGADAVTTSKPRGLWALMGAPDASASESAPPIPKSESDLLAEAARPDFMKRRAPASTATESAESTHADSKAAAESLDASMPSARLLPLPGIAATRPSSSLSEDDDEQDGHEVDDESEPARPKGLLAGDKDHPQLLLAHTRTVRRCINAVICGVLAVLLSPLNLLPSIAAKVPAVIVGLIAVFVGHQGFVDARRFENRRALNRLAIAAIGLGLLGMLAGPAGLIAVGQRMHLAALQRGATDRLQKLGGAIDAYEKDNDEYPKGGTVARDADGDEIGMHGWQTFLLPYLGQQELHRKLDLKQSFDHPTNRPVMSQVVPDFLVPNVEHVPTKSGLATTHFAGVGGQGNGPNGIVNFGIFNRNVTVRRSDVSDGLSQTMFVGEIAQQLPAWGDPENWREIETGLNRHSVGFGNKEGTGAHFLMGDGSVRFFPNSTSREVLEKLSTRDGAEAGMLLGP